MNSSRLVIPGGIVVVVIGAIGVAFPPLVILPAAIAAAAAVIMSAQKPQFAIPVAILTPFLNVEFNRSLPSYLALLILTIAAARAWPSATRSTRKGALLILALGSCSLVIGLSFNPLPERVEPVALAVIYATLTGFSSALVRPPIVLVAVSLTTVGMFTSVLAFTSPTLSADRGTVILGENANGIGFLACVGFVAALILARSTRCLYIPLWIFAAAVCILGILAAESRGSVLAALSALFFMLFHSWIKDRPKKAAVALGLFSAALYLLAIPLSKYFVDFVGREENIADASTETRQNIVVYALKTGISNPITGVGLGQFANYSRVDPMSGLHYRAHNVYAGIFAETGILVFSMLIAVIALALRNSRIRGARDTLPLAVTVLINGFALEWWGASRTGPLALAILGIAIGMNDRAVRSDHSRSRRSFLSRGLWAKGPGGAAGRTVSNTPIVDVTKNPLVPSRFV